jgi:DNA-directed RNA polymerase subunit alpha
MTAEENIDEEAELGTIPVDSVFSPVYRVKFSIENTRVGKITNYDRLILEIWTDGTVTPEQALTEASKIYRKHLNPFVQYNEATEELSLEQDFLAQSEEGPQEEEMDEEKLRMKETLDRPLESLDLSVRARNCLDTEDIRYVRDLVAKTENEILKVKNFGKTSMKEVKQKLESMGLSLGMDLSDFK